jgi:hypothetical protein
MTHIFSELQELLLDLERRGVLTTFIRFARSQGIPNPQNGLDLLMGGAFLDIADKPYISAAKAEALKLAVAAYEKRLASASDERDLVFDEIAKLFTALAPYTSMVSLPHRLYDVRVKFDLIASAYDVRMIQRIKAGEYMRVTSGGHNNYLFSLIQALNMRDALAEMLRRSQQENAIPSPIFDELKTTLQRDFMIKPIGRVTRLLALEGVEISEQSLLALRAGRSVNVEGRRRISERRAHRLYTALQSIQQGV